MKRILVILGLAGGLCLCLFRHWEPGGETWGYWMFARIFEETHRFLVFERAPLYPAYLSLFRVFGYPLEITVEYLVTTGLSVAAIVLLFRRIMGLPLAAFAAFLWIPYLQICEPVVQKMALTFSFFAILVRISPNIKNRIPLFYALAILAFMSRITYSAFILPFAVWDIWKLRTLRPRLRYGPIAAVLFLALWISLVQSPHKWNNVWFDSTSWFPTNGKTLRDSAFLHMFGWEYTRVKYGTFEGKDFYFITPELFGKARTLPAAVLANPRFVAEQVGRNLKSIAVITSSLTLLPWIFKAPSDFSLQNLAIMSGAFLYVIFLIYGAFRACPNKEMALFILGNVLVIISTLISLPKWNYMLPLIPITCCSAWWFGTKLQPVFKKAGFLAVPFCLLAFSPGDTDWLRFFKHLSRDIQQGDVRILQQREASMIHQQEHSMKRAFAGEDSAALKSELNQCRGIMTLEHTFLTAFTDLPLEKIYDVWEIPPFGKLGDPDYDGLRPDRIDCLLVSDMLTSPIYFGFNTNWKIRYDNYILPYIKRLQEAGAVSYEIPGYGRLYKEHS